MKDKIKKNKKIIIAALSILIFLLILRDIFKYEITIYDNWAYKTFVESIRNNNLTQIMKFFSFLGSGIFLISLVASLLLLLKNKKDGLLASINIALIYIINNIIKVIIRRPRPSGYNLIIEKSFSFPSGHSMVSTAVYGFLIYLIYKNINNRKLKYLLIILSFMVIILICISRVYLGVHYLSDTLGGFFFSISYLMIFITYVPKIIKYKEKDNKNEKKN